MDNYAKTFKYIAAILSFETSDKTIEETISHPNFNWDPIVIEGSKYLVLTTIYCRLKSRQLLHLLPEDLVQYLQEISTINRNRNTSILKQVQFISQVLKESNIDHVFLKGSALLVSGKYEDIAERMIGDIDILVDSSQTEQAFHLLKSRGYNKTFGYAYEKKDFRHMDRLISDNELAAIEIHSNLLNKNDRHLIDITSVLNSKIESNQIFIPNYKNLSLHQILGWQLNDKGHFYNFPSFKVLYDIIITESHKNKTLISTLLSLRQGQSFIAIAQIYFSEFSSISTNRYMKYKQYLHIVNMKFKPIRVIHNVTKSTFNYIWTRITLIFTNKYYFRHIWNMIFSKKK